MEYKTDLNFNYKTLYINDKPVTIETIDDYIIFKESLEPYLNRNDRKEIVWFNEKNKTEYSVYFLHGFNTTKHEGRSFSINFAKTIKANLLLARLPGYGVYNKENSFNNITFYDYLRNIYDDMLLLSILGNKIILIGSSTGCTFNVIASVIFKNINIYRNIFFSPNLGLHSFLNNMTTILSYGYGKTILRMLNNKIKIDGEIVDMNIFKSLIGSMKAYNNIKEEYKHDFIIFVSKNDYLISLKKINDFFEKTKADIKHYYILKNERIHPVINSKYQNVFLNKIDFFLNQNSKSKIKLEI